MHIDLSIEIRGESYLKISLLINSSDIPQEKFIGVRSQHDHKEKRSEYS